MLYLLGVKGDLVDCKELIKKICSNQDYLYYVYNVKGGRLIRNLKKENLEIVV